MKCFLQLLSLFAVLINLQNDNISAQTTSKKSSIAVLDFIPISQISAEETALLTEKFRHALIKLDKFVVVERSKMESILNEQEFSMTDQCNTNECAVQVGQLLAAERIIMGNIGKIGGTYSITIRMIDVSTGQSVNSVDYEHKGSADDLLDVFRKLAVELVSPASKSREKILIFNGALSTNEINESYTALSKIKDIKDIQELSIQQDRRKYRVVYEGKSISTLRQQLTETFKKYDFKLILSEQSEDILEFTIIKHYTTAPTFPLKLFGFTGLVTAGGGAYSYLTAKKSYDKFKKANNTAEAIRYKDRTKKYDKYTLYAAAGFGGSLLCYWLYSKIYNATLPEKISFYVEPTDTKRALIGISTRF